MKTMKPRAVIAFAALMIGFAAFSASNIADAADKAKPAAVAPAKAGDDLKGQEIQDTGWQKRCSPADPKVKDSKEYCEIFQRLQVKKGPRVAEFGIGFPEGKDKALGVVVLPLGILLEQGVAMKIDEEKPSGFKVRYCINEGCVSYVNLNKDLLNTMKKSKQITFVFGTADGRNVNLVMKLEGFDKVLKEVQ